jgi:hypothetical protein
MTTTEGELLEDELVEEPAGVELMRHASTLFRTDDPKVALQRMAEIAKEIVEVIDAQKLFVRISGKKYVTCPGWKTVGGIHGLNPYTVWTRPNEAGDGYVARVEIRTLDERTIAAAEAECARDEKLWKDRPKHSLRSMAETRATSRALRGPLEQIMVLAGYAPTAAEEMSEDADAPQAATRSPVDPVGATAEQKAEIAALVRTLTETDPETDWPQRCREISGVPGNLLTRVIAGQLIEKLRRELATFHD